MPQITPQQDAALRRAFDLIAMREASAALQLCERVMPGLMKHARALRIYSIALIETGHHERAVKMIDKAIRLDPMKPNLRTTRGKILNHAARFEEAATEFERVLALDPGFTEALEGLVRARRMLRQNDEAWRAVELARERGVPQDGYFAIALAEAAQGVKQTQGVAEVIQGCLESGQRLDRLVGLLLPFHLGKMLELEGRYDEAFEAYTRANEQVGAPFDPEMHRRATDELLAAWSAADLAPIEGAPQDRLIFVVGMPRSGTTLTEQILCAHPGVVSAGETLMLPLAIRDAGIAGPPADYAVRVARLDPPRARAAAERCIAGIRQRAGTQRAELIVDKLPLNAMNIPFAAKLFPNARFIACKRDPRDTCLSCYQHFFSGGSQFAYDLAHLGHAYADIDRAMDHAAGLLPDRVRIQRYEDIVEDLETNARGIAEAAGIEFDEAALRFWDSANRPATASYDQVSRPIYSSSRGRWRRYEHHLAPLIDALKQRGVDLPD